MDGALPPIGDLMKPLHNSVSGEPLDSGPDALVYEARAGRERPMGAQALYHRLGTVLETVSTSEKKNPAGRTWRFTRCRVKWNENNEIAPIDLSEDYQPGDRVAVVFRGGSQICDLNLRTGRQSMIGDRVEGIAAFILFLSVPLCFILIGIPIYYAVTLYSKVTTSALRKRVAVYVEDMMSRLGASAGVATAAQ
jgi:hypothetical protein